MAGPWEELVSGRVLGCCRSPGVLSACSRAKAAEEYLHFGEPHSQLNCFLFTSQKSSP